MKKVRIFMSVLAVVFAMGGAIASVGFDTAIHGYRFIDNPFPTADVCQDEGAICNTAGSSLCTVTVNSTAIQLHNFVSPTNCDNAILKRL